MYCIVTVVRFVIILIKVYVCMYVARAGKQDKHIINNETIH